MSEKPKRVNKTADMKAYKREYMRKYLPEYKQKMIANNPEKFMQLKEKRIQKYREHQMAEATELIKSCGLDPEWLIINPIQMQVIISKRSRNDKIKVIQTFLEVKKALLEKIDIDALKRELDIA